MSPLKQTAQNIVEQFDRHQSLRLLMKNTLEAIIETEVGKLLAAAQTEANHLRFQLADATNAAADRTVPLVGGGTTVMPLESKREVMP